MFVKLSGLMFCEGMARKWNRKHIDLQIQGLNQNSFTFFFLVERLDNFDWMLPMMYLENGGDSIVGYDKMDGTNAMHNWSKHDSIVVSVFETQTTVAAM